MYEIESGGPTSVLQSAGLLTASNGAEALLLLERQDRPVHLMFTDVVMPGMSGRDLATQLKRLYQNPTSAR